MSSDAGERIGRLGSSGLGRLARIAAIGVGTLVLLVLIPTAMTYINPGHVGIVIHRVGGGVDPIALGPGLHGRNPLTTGIEEYPTFMQTVVLTKAAGDGSARNDEINVNSVEGQPLSLDVSMSFELDPTRSRRSTRPSAPTSRPSSTAT